VFYYNTDTKSIFYNKCDEDKTYVQTMSYVKVLFFVLGAFLGPVVCKVDPCRLPKDPGRCRANKQMFYFNYDTKRCEGFLYKGCGGNANRFENLEICHEACLQHLVSYIYGKKHLQFGMKYKLVFMF